MESEIVKLLGLALLAVAALWLGRTTHRRSLARQPLHGGLLSALFSFLSGLCFVAILPTVCMSVVVLHPPSLQLAGLTWHPILAIVLCMGAGSLLFSLLHGIFERAPRARALEAQAARQGRGWTEEDARSSGL